VVARSKHRQKRTKLAIFAKAGDRGLPMEEAILKTNRAGLVIASNKRITQAIVDSDEWETIRPVFGCWTGTLVAYDEPDKKLGKTIEYVDERTGICYTIDVPEEHRGKKNVVLVAEHPGIDIEKTKSGWLVNASRLDVLGDFPTVDGWYLGDPKYDIPTGKRLPLSYLWYLDRRSAKDDPDLPPDIKAKVRHIFRNEKRVGLIAKGFCWVGLDGRAIINYSPSNTLGVAVEGTSEQLAAAGLHGTNHVSKDRF